MKDGVDHPLSVSSSVVVLSELAMAPKRSTPLGEAQAVWSILLFPKVWVFFHRPEEKVTHDLRIQVTYPVCECQ